MDLSSTFKFLNTLSLLLKPLLLVADPHLLRAAALLLLVVAVHPLLGLVRPLPVEAVLALLTVDAVHTLVHVHHPGTAVDETHSLDETVTVSALDLLAAEVVVLVEEDSQEAADHSLPEEGTMDGGERGAPLRPCLCVNGVSVVRLGGRRQSTAVVRGQSRVRSARVVRVVVRGRVRLSGAARVLVEAGVPLGGGVGVGRGVTLGDGVLV